MKRISVIIALAAAGVAAQAQNLNPTVEVTNIYEGSVTRADKPDAPVTVPDSVTVFNLDFDYSTFERPYMGAYDFSPYLIALKPSPSASNPGRLFVKAGAGYRLRPEAEVVWTPFRKSDFHPGLYGSLHSFFGPYHNITESGGKLAPDGYFNGFDAAVRAGTNGVWFLPKAIFSYDVHYDGIFTRDTLRPVRSVHMADGTIRLRSAYERPGRFFYDAAFSYRYAREIFGGTEPLREHRAFFDSTFGYDLSSEQRFSVDADVMVSDIGGIYDGYGAYVRFLPKYRLDRGRWHLSAGVALSITMGSGRREVEPAIYGSQGYQVVYPDLFLGFEVVRERLLLYGKVTGGERINSFSDLVLENHFFSKRYGSEGSFLDFSADRVNASIGLRGNISARFHYDLFGGFASVKNGLLYSTGGPSVAYRNHNLWYLTLLTGWDSPHCRVDGGFFVRKTDLDERKADVFAPGVFSGYFKAEYIYKSRLAVGLDCSFSTAMRSYGEERLTVPGWFDLGLIADFSVTRRLSIWARSGNLIGMTIQKVPYYSEKGRWVTAGVKFIL